MAEHGVDWSKGLQDLEMSVAGRLETLVDQWNQKIWKVNEWQKSANQSFS